MSRFIVVCLLLSISQISFSKSESMTEFSKRVLSDIRSIAVEKPNENYFKLAQEFVQCRKGLKMDAAYQNCIEKVLKNIDQVLQNNLKLIGACVAADIGVSLTEAALTDVGCPSTANTIRQSFNVLAIVPAIGLVLDTWALLILGTDIKRRLNEVKKQRS